MFHFFRLLALIIVLSACVNTRNLDEGITEFRAQKYRDAFIHLKPEAEKGQPDAQYAIGFMFYYGQGIMEDRKRALIWISRAASAGQKDAILALEILTHFPQTSPLRSEPFRNEL